MDAILHGRWILVVEDQPLVALEVDLEALQAEVGLDHVGIVIALARPDLRVTLLEPLLRRNLLEGRDLSDENSIGELERFRQLNPAVRFGFLSGSHGRFTRDDLRLLEERLAGDELAVAIAERRREGVAGVAG
jgi:hypothetical protein